MGMRSSDLSLWDAWADIPVELLSRQMYKQFWSVQRGPGQRYRSESSVTMTPQDSNPQSERLDQWSTSIITYMLVATIIGGLSREKMTDTGSIQPMGRDIHSMSQTDLILWYDMGQTKINRDLWFLSAFNCFNCKK